MSTETETPTKVFEQRIVYRLLVSDEEAPAGSATARRMVCTYHNGVRIYGNVHAPHPPMVISAKDQDEIVWAGAVEFKVGLKLAPNQFGPEKPFHRDQDFWFATEGNDGIWRMSTGPLNATGLNGPVVYKFTITRTNGGKPDLTREPLDPHIILVP